MWDFTGLVLWTMHGLGWRALTEDLGLEGASEVRPPVISPLRRLMRPLAMPW